MVPAEAIVLEKSARWAPELHRQLQEDGTIIRVCRDVAGLKERVVAGQTAGKDCIAVLDPTGWPGECLPLMAWLRDQGIRTVVVGYPGIELLEPSLRELGATALLLPPVAGHEISDVCRRLLEQHPVQSRPTGSH